MAAMTDHRSLADSLSKALHLAVAPIGISFGPEAAAGVPAFDEPMAEPASDGRAGREVLFLPVTLVDRAGGSPQNAAASRRARP